MQPCRGSRGLQHHPEAEVESQGGESSPQTNKITACHLPQSLLQTHTHSFANRPAYADFETASFCVRAASVLLPGLVLHGPPSLAWLHEQLPEIGADRSLPRPKGPLRAAWAWATLCCAKPEPATPASSLPTALQDPSSCRRKEDLPQPHRLTGRTLHTLLEPPQIPERRPFPPLSVPFSFPHYRPPAQRHPQSSVLATEFREKEVRALIFARGRTAESARVSHRHSIPRQQQQQQHFAALLPLLSLALSCSIAEVADEIVAISGQIPLHGLSRHPAREVNA